MSKKRKRHTPEQIVRKLRDADAMLTSGKSLGEVVQSLAIKSWLCFFSMFPGAVFEVSTESTGMSGCAILQRTSLPHPTPLSKQINNALVFLQVDCQNLCQRKRNKGGEKGSLVYQ